MRSLLLLLCCGLLLSACGQTPKAESGATNDADRAFARDMIAHHQSAIAMARLAETRAEHREIRDLSAGIIRGQSKEIAILKPFASGSGHQHMDMSHSEMGMDGDLSKLAAARPFDRAFLDMMIEHHQGALAMAQAELRDGSNARLLRLAQSIIDAQSVEIMDMQEWHKAWYGKTMKMQEM